MQDSVGISELKTGLRGAVIERGDPGYEEARALYNAMIDKQPRVIARCVDAADVITAVKFGRDSKLPIAIRGGGHNGPGLASVNDGLVIDLSAMKGVRVDPATSIVRVEPGCTQGDVDHATHAFGLAVPAGIVSTTGIAGLTLGGGTGYLTRKHGLTVDNLIEADVVLADGNFVTASKEKNADLLWALCGGGGNFGVVTSFVFKAHPVSMVYGGPMFWEIKDARRIMQWYRDFLPKASPDWGVFVGIKTMPSTDPFPQEYWGKKIVALIGCFNGAATDGEKAFAPVRNELPKPIVDWVGPMPFPALQSLFDPLMPKGMQWYWKGAYVKELSDKAIDVHLEYISKSPSELSLMHLYPIDGAVHKTASGDTAWNCRDASWSMVIAAIDPDPAKAADLKRWGRSYWEAVNPFTTGGAYVNFMMDDEVEGRIQKTYGDNYERLVAIKRKYDPTNLFKVNQNIKP
jgi:hypothetical protein